MVVRSAWVEEDSKVRKSSWQRKTAGSSSRKKVAKVELNERGYIDLEVGAEEVSGLGFRQSPPH